MAILVFSRSTSARRALELDFNSDLDATSTKFQMRFEGLDWRFANRFYTFGRFK